MTTEDADVLERAAIFRYGRIPLKRRLHIRVQHKCFNITRFIGQKNEKKVGKKKKQITRPIGNFITRNNRTTRFCFVARLFD